MVTAYDISKQELVEALAKELKNNGEIKAPEWASYVKTGVHKERPPVETDWWFSRTAAVLRSVSELGPIGVSKLRTKYGGRKNRGVRPEKFFKGSGSIIRKALQQLEEAGYIKKDEKGVRKGRVTTPEGVSFIDKTASKIIKK